MDSPENLKENSPEHSKEDSKTPPKNTEISNKQLKAALGKKVDVLAFGISYVGILKKVSIDKGVIQIQDGKDFVVLEVERIESFKTLRN